MSKRHSLGEQAGLGHFSTNSVLQNHYRRVSMADVGRSRLHLDTQLQIDDLINECNSTVPHMIGKIRQNRTTMNHLILPVGYRTRDLLSKHAAKNWKH